MRSRSNCIINSGQVHSWALESLLHAKLVKDHGWKCSAVIVLCITLRAAARCISVAAACRDLVKAPSDRAVMTALNDTLPKTLAVLERRLNDALVGPLPRRMRRRAWNVAIDWHLQPYYGEPFQRRNELYYGRPKQGTTKFHAYAAACIVEHGHRYTLALTWVQRHESWVCVLRRLVARIRESGLKIRRLLSDRAFFHGAVAAFLQAEKLPFVMPVVIRGRPPKRRRKPTGLRWITHQAAGWYPHVIKHEQQPVKISVCVGCRRHRHPKEGTRRHQKLLFAAWDVPGSPTEIRRLYRLRFGIETSFRQLREARVYTCTRNPRLRLFFPAVALILRNIWVWIHQTRLAEGSDDNLILHLELLRFKQMLDWIVCEIIALFRNGSIPCVIRPP